MLANRGDSLPVSAFPVDGTWPTGTARWEKRNLAASIPVWDERICIQCNKCAMVCPHAAIRVKVYDEALVAGAPVQLDLTTVQTNIVVFHLPAGLPDATTVVAAARERGVHTLVGGIDAGNAASLALHRALGFEHEMLLTLHHRHGIGQLDETHAGMRILRRDRFVAEIEREPVSAGLADDAGEQHSGRLEGQIVFNRLLERFPTIDPAGPDPLWRPSVTLRGLEELRITVRPA